MTSQNQGTSEDSGYSAAQLLARNSPWVREGAQNFNTPLPPEQEAAFQQWVQTHNVPFNPADPTPDYDMRGFWLALQQGDPRAQTAIDPNDGRTHFPDYWKTPYSATFSKESQWANPQTAPSWSGDRLVTPSGVMVYDDKTRQWNSALFQAPQQPQSPTFVAPNVPAGTYGNHLLNPWQGALAPSLAPLVPTKPLRQSPLR